MRNIQLILIFTNLAAAAVSLILLFLKKNKMGFAAALAAFCITLSLFILNWIQAGYVPFKSMYHVMTTVALCMVPAYFLIQRKKTISSDFKYYIFAIMVFLVGAIFTSKNQSTERVPALQSIWFVPHIFCYCFSYALLAVAFIVRISGYFTKDPNIQKTSANIIRFSFQFLTAGLVIGAIWAEAAWGGFWSWDPKETWALLSWLFYALFLHVRKDQKLIKFQDVFHYAGFISVVITFLIVNLLPAVSGGMHSY